MAGTLGAARVPPSVDKVADRVSISFALQIPAPIHRALCHAHKHPGKPSVALTTVLLDFYWILFSLIFFLLLLLVCGFSPSPAMPGSFPPVY
jgi:hypothetical protein